MNKLGKYIRKLSKKPSLPWRLLVIGKNYVLAYDFDSLGKVSISKRLDFTKEQDAPAIEQWQKVSSCIEPSKYRVCVVLGPSFCRVTSERFAPFLSANDRPQSEHQWISEIYAGTIHAYSSTLREYIQDASLVTTGVEWLRLALGSQSWLCFWDGYVLASDTNFCVQLAEEHSLLEQATGFNQYIFPSLTKRTDMEVQEIDSQAMAERWYGALHPILS